MLGGNADFFFTFNWSRVISKPLINALPPEGLASMVSILTVVVFPAPFGPSRPKISPPAISRFRPATALIFPFKSHRYD